MLDRFDRVVFSVLTGVAISVALWFAAFLTIVEAYGRQWWP